VKRRLERVEPTVIPLGHAFFAAARHVGHVDADRLRLADAIQPPDALLQEPGIQRQIEEHQMVRELKIAALAADLRAQEQLRAVGLGKPRRVAVALHERQAFVKLADLRVDPLLQRGLDRRDFALRFADQQNLRSALLLDEIHQPLDARVFF